MQETVIVWLARRLLSWSLIADAFAPRLLVFIDDWLPVVGLIIVQQTTII